MLSGRMALAHPEREIFSIQLGELDAAHAQASAASALEDLFDAAQRGDALPARAHTRRRAAKGFQAGIQIAVIARIHRRYEILVRITKQLEPRDRWIEAKQAKRGGALVALRQV